MFRAIHFPTVVQIFAMLKRPHPFVFVNSKTKKKCVEIENCSSETEQKPAAFKMKSSMDCLPSLILIKRPITLIRADTFEAQSVVVRLLATPSAPKNVSNMEL